MNTHYMIMLVECAKVLGMAPVNLRNEIILKHTLFNAWAFRHRSGKYTFLIPRKSFEN